MSKTKTVSINTEAAAKLEDIACFDLAGWAEDFARLAGSGHESRDEITQALWALMPLIKQRQETIDASESGEVSKKVFRKHAAELTEMLADVATPAVDVDPVAVRAEVLGERAVAIVSAPLNLDLAQELVDLGRAGSKDFAFVAVQVAEAILKEDALRVGREFPAVAAISPATEPTPIAA